jgi:hypothetical protein
MILQLLYNSFTVYGTNSAVLTEVFGLLSPSFGRLVTCTERLTSMTFDSKSWLLRVTGSSLNSSVNT